MRKMLLTLGLIVGCFMAAPLVAEGGSDEYQVPHLSDEEARDLDHAGIIIMDFYADSCGSCRSFAPIFNQFAEEHQEEIRCFKVNVDDADDLSSGNEIQYIPTIICYLDGTEVERLVGEQTLERLEEMLETAQVSQEDAE